MKTAYNTGFVLMGRMDWTLQGQFKMYHSNLSRLITGVVRDCAVGAGIWRAVRIVIP